MRCSYGINQMDTRAGEQVGRAIAPEELPERNARLAIKALSVTYVVGVPLAFSVSRSWTYYFKR